MQYPLLPKAQPLAASRSALRAIAAWHAGLWRLLCRACILQQPPLAEIPRKAPIKHR